VDSLKSHYRLLLGLDKSWDVTSVDLHVGSKSVTSALEYRGRGGVSGVHGGMWSERSCSGAVMAASRHDTVRDDSESSNSASELFEVWREDDYGFLGREAFSIHVDV